MAHRRLAISYVRVELVDDSAAFTSELIHLRVMDLLRGW